MKPNVVLLLFVALGLLVSGCSVWPHPDYVVQLIRLATFTNGRIVLAEGMTVDSLGVDFYEPGTETRVADFDLKAGVWYDFAKREGSPASEIYITIPEEVLDSATVSVAKRSEVIRCSVQWARDIFGKWCEVKDYPDIKYSPWGW